MSDQVADSAQVRIRARTGSWLGYLGALLPHRGDYSGFRKSWKSDVLAGLTVAVVALPLALAFGVASGMGATAGLVTAVVGGAIAAIFGGSNFQVSGPTGAMTVVLIPVVATFGQSAALTVAVMAGVLIVAMGVFGLGRLVTLIPWPVIEGFTVGIALIIALQQVPNVLGVAADATEKTVVNAADSLVHVTAQALPEIIVTLATIVLILVIARIRKSLPGSLIAIGIVTAATLLVGTQMPTVGKIPNLLPAPSLPDLSVSTMHSLIGSALAVAVLAGIESLLSARVADGMVDSKPCEPDRELLGQGLANIGSGIFGGMPATGAIARTAVNVRAGAHTRVSAFVHSIVLLLIILVGSSLVAAIPLAALAGVLLVTAYRMIEPRALTSMWHSPLADRLVFLLTAAATVFLDLIVAVEIGIVLAAVFALMNVARASGATQEDISDFADRIDADTEHDLLRHHIVVYRIEGSVFFGASQRFLDELTAISDVRVVILRMSGMATIDATGAQALKAVVQDLTSRGVVVIFKGLKAKHQAMLTNLHAFDAEGGECRNFDTIDEAFQYAQMVVDRSTTA